MTSSDWIRTLQIVSGGQTGVDRAALDVALELEVAHGGWCPRGRRAEDGVIPDRYQLEETPSRNYAVRTLKNVVSSDATLILTRGPLTGGTKLTVDYAAEQEKPCLIVNLADARDPSPVARWLRGVRPRILNVAGPRASSVAGVYDQAREFLQTLFRELRSGEQQGNGG